jgi:hypothetical protein
VEVLGEFELQRSMAWTWDAGYSAWTSQVSCGSDVFLTTE